MSNDADSMFKAVNQQTQLTDVAFFTTRRREFILSSGFRKEAQVRLVPVVAFLFLSHTHTHTHL